MPWCPYFIWMKSPVLAVGDVPDPHLHGHKTTWVHVLPHWLCMPHGLSDQIVMHPQRTVPLAGKADAAKGKVYSRWLCCS